MKHHITILEHRLVMIESRAEMLATCRCVLEHEMRVLMEWTPFFKRAAMCLH